MSEGIGEGGQVSEGVGGQCGAGDGVGGQGENGMGEGVLRVREWVRMVKVKTMAEEWVGRG